MTGVVEPRLEGKVALVTGGGRGLGREIALQCAREGAHLVLVSRSREDLESTAAEVRAIGRRAVMVALDIRDPSAIGEAVRRANDELGPIDLAVANSGISGPSAPIWEVEFDDWNDTFSVNVTGVYRTCHALLPSMIARQQGSVVVIGSMTGKRPLQHRSAYAASKTALIGLVRTVATDTGPYGVRVNLVSPGPIEGGRLEQVIASQAAARGLTLSQSREEFLSASPLRRNAKPEDVARAVVFLLSDDARSITGEDLNVSSGTVTY